MHLEGSVAVAPRPFSRKAAQAYFTPVLRMLYADAASTIPMPYHHMDTVITCMRKKDTASCLMISDNCIPLTIRLPHVPKVDQAVICHMGYRKHRVGGIEHKPNRSTEGGISLVERTRKQ